MPPRPASPRPTSAAGSRARSRGREVEPMPPRRARQKRPRPTACPRRGAAAGRRIISRSLARQSRGGGARRVIQLVVVQRAGEGVGRTAGRWSFGLSRSGEQGPGRHPLGAPARLERRGEGCAGGSEPRREVEARRGGRGRRRRWPEAPELERAGLALSPRARRIRILHRLCWRPEFLRAPSNYLLHTRQTPDCLSDFALHCWSQC